MALTFKVEVSPAVIRWARESVGYSPEDISRKLGISLEKYLQVETGQQKLTFTQLKRLSKILKRPISILLNEKVPEEPTISSSFRILPKKETGFSITFRFVLRKALYYQSIARNIMQDLGVSPEARIFNRTLEEDPRLVAKEERYKLSVAYEFKNSYHAFDYYRRRIESFNIFVFQMSFPLTDARAFILTEPKPVVIVINSRDNIQARTFSLLHEYAHALLGISEVYTENEAFSLSHQVERWCDTFAAEFLVPENIFLEEVRIQNSKGIKEEELIKKLSEKFRVSKMVIINRIMELVPEENEKIKSIKEKLLQEQVVEEFYPRVKYEKRKIAELGHNYIGLIFDAVDRGIITYNKALEYLELKRSHMEKIERIFAGHVGVHI